MMDTKLEQFDRTMNSLLLCLNTCPSESGGTPEWFISFGTLLGFIRERGKNIGDIDVSMFYEDGCGNQLINLMCQFNFKVNKKIVDPLLKDPLYVSFVPVDRKMYGDNHVDIFFWFKGADNRYYHTYDYEMTNPTGGPQKEYIFKGVDGDILRGASWHEVWPSLNQVVRLPSKYGSLLDYWYPGWMRKDEYFGQSKTEYFVRVKNPDLLKNKDLIRPQIEESKKNYKEFIDGYCRKSVI